MQLTRIEHKLSKKYGVQVTTTLNIGALICVQPGDENTNMINPMRQT